MKSNHHLRIRKLILHLLIPVFVLTGCSKDNSKSIVYNGEKLYYKAEKLSETAAVKPELTSRAGWDNIKNAYFDVTGYCWRNIDSLPKERFPDERKELETIAFRAVGRLAQIYFSEKEYDSAILVIRQLSNFADLEGFQLLSSQLNLAKAFQAKGNPEETASIYRTLMDAFYPPVDNNNEIIDVVLNLPLEIVQTYRLLGDEESILKESRVAELYYNRLISDWPNSTLETSARNSLARLYNEMENWDKAVEALSLIRDSSGQVEIEAAMMVADIFLDAKKDYDTAIELYDELQARVNDTMILPIIHMRRGIAYFEKRDYEKCRKSMSRIGDDYAYFFRNISTPQKYIALSFERLGNWVRAENEFKWLIDNYPATEDAFEAYLSIAEHYEKVKSPDLARLWYRRAGEFYTMMANQHAGSEIELSAIAYLAEVAKREERWDQVVKYLESLYTRFPDSEIGRMALANASSVYREKFGDSAKADSLMAGLKAELMTQKDSKNINVITDDNK